MAKTVFSKIWLEHVIAERDDGTSLIYIDRHYTHEVTSPVAFENLRSAGRRVRRPDLTFAVMDHNVPTHDRTLPVTDEMSAAQMEALKRNAREFGIALFDYFSPFQGIVHVIMPELGLTLPGLTIACGDSHTSTHGAFGAAAFGIGTSEGEHVFATQTLWIKRPKEMLVEVRGELDEGVTSKDVILKLIGEIGTGGGIGHVMEFAGETVERMGIDDRMTLCNMSIEGGARTAIIAPDEKVFRFVEGRPFAPEGEDLEEAFRFWSTLRSDAGARYDKTVRLDVDGLEPQVTWGTNPAQVAGVTDEVPSPEEFEDPAKRAAAERALKYMGLRPGQRIRDVPVDVVFIGSCTNARLSDLVQVARLVKGRKVADGVKAVVVPGSMLTKRWAERLGVHRALIEAGFEWRNSGCSYCIAMAPGDYVEPGKRCASTSNRNFENRQGPGARTHLVSPLTAAATAIEGRFADPRAYELYPVEDVVSDLELYEWLRERYQF
ncbi:MAG: 3-isopropylmalate dehydratase large subunit [Thaumarchaeota archaeon]|nr:3-isopropylmalate dehydratase large subunit [Candidatus Calditenuaceae archaeon]MDW8042996.1 3-isopropylmalate dehydratase large subunit [Nitrososphaerota archaeon]